MSDSPAAPVKRKPLALGRGLGALMGEARREEPLVTAPASLSALPAKDGSLAMLAVADITPHPDQPRTYFDESALDELAASIAARGVIQPVIVRRQGEGSYQLVAGERRWRAAQRAQLHEIPALIRDLSDRDVMALALIENLQREDLNPVEEARAYRRLADIEQMSQAEIAKLVDKSRSHVANMQRLMSLPPPVLEMVEQGRLSLGHAKVLLGSDNALAYAEMALEKQLSVRQIERMVRQANTAARPGAARRQPGQDAGFNADMEAVQRHLEEFLGLPVRIARGAEKSSGTVTIRYNTLDQLDLVCQRLTGGQF